MTHDNEKVARLLAVQEIDLEIVELQNRRDALPERRAEVAREITALEEERETAKGDLERNRVERRTRETEVDAGREKLERYERQLNEVKTNVAYSALLSEIRTAKTEVSGIEEEILDRMEKIEALETRIGEIDAELEVKRDAARDELRAIDAEIEKLDGEIAEAQERRQGAAEDVDPRLSSLYDRLRRKQRFPALVPLKGQACGSCYARMPPQVVQEIQHGGALHPCEHCGVLVYSTPAETAQPADVPS